jgi:2-polyprenyl-3-methyl-5-hydroxy-6-metoxy-1,4-benzoquinol methylase
MARRTARICTSKQKTNGASQSHGDPAAFERKIAITKSLMTPRDIVLDVGCGTGSLAMRLSPCGAHVHGLDLSSEMILIARGKAKAAEATNVTFHVGPFDDSFTVFEDGSEQTHRRLHERHQATITVDISRKTA